MIFPARFLETDEFGDHSLPSTTGVIPISCGHPEDSTFLGKLFAGIQRTAFFSAIRKGAVMKNGSEQPGIKFVEPNELYDLIESEGAPTVIDTQPDVHDFIMGHVPGAAYMNEKLLRCSCKDGLPACYVPEQVVEILFRRVGIQNRKPIVVYSGSGAYSKQGDGLEAAMVGYSLARFGHTKVFLLDGGIQRWHDDGFPLTKTVRRIDTGDFTPDIRRDLFVDYEQFRSIRNRPDVQVLDVRPPSVYEGPAVWEKPGHIPGAKNMPWRLFMDRENAYLLKTKEEISRLLDEVGADPGKETVVYCGTGREATNAFIVLKHVMGFPNVRIFEGSFTQWVSYSKNPTKTGAQP